jgi:hypothetical protein
MLDFFKFILSGFWVFIGFCIIFSMALTFIGVIWNRFFRHWNIRKHGYPPNTDADGDFLKQDTD